MNNSYNPCWNCKKRTIYCHGDCDDYKHFLKIKDELKKCEKNDVISHIESSASWCWDHRGIKKS